MYSTTFIGQALRQQISIQFRIRSDFWKWNQKVPPSVTNPVFHTALFMALSGRAKMALEQVMTAEGQETRLFLACLAAQNVFDSSFQVVIADALRHPFEVPKGGHMPF